MSAAFAGSAAAQRAPIVYAGQGAGASTPVAEAPGATLSASLAGGDDNSYGYGANVRRGESAVIDLRRNASSAAPPARRPATQTARSSAPIVYREQAVVEAPAQPALAPEPSQLQPAQGARPWLERERVGPPYEANGRWYVPTPEPGYEQTGIASWYGPRFHSRRTANGEVFDQEAITGAHPTLPLNSLVQVTNLDNGREIIVRINDRGPFVGERLIDLSHGAAVALDFERAGRARVHLRYLGPAPRRVAGEGTPAPAAGPPAATSGELLDPSQPEEGPASLLPPQAQTEPAPTAFSTGYFVQVGAFSDPANAERMRDAVSGAGPALVDTRRTAAGAVLHRVRVGPWAEPAEAEAARQTLAAMGYGDSVVAGR